MSSPQRICLFGGTFDPIHNAHLRIACEARDRIGLNRVLFVPAGRPPHKEADHVTPFEHRYQMVAAACAGQAGFEATRFEEPPHSSYSIDTVEMLRSQVPSHDRLFFLIGSDAFDDIKTWKRWQDLSRLVTFIVAARPGKEYKVPDNARVQRLDSLTLDISSSEIRDELAASRETAELPKSVLNYIKQHRLYGWQDSKNGS